jgi:hypothetical protein
MYRVKKVEALAGFRLAVEFEDGVSGVVDLSEEVFGEMFEPLRDEAYFRQVGIDEFGVICWPNGADLAPDALHQELAAQERAPAAV